MNAAARRAGGRRLARVGLVTGTLVLVWVALSLLLPDDTAFAHANLARASPAPNSVLDEAPSRVAIWFTEPVEPSLSEIQVLDPQGSRVDDGDSLVDANDPLAMSVGLGPVPDGTYTVAWKNVSTVDGPPSPRVFRLLRRRAYHWSVHGDAQRAAASVSLGARRAVAGACERPRDGRRPDIRPAGLQARSALQRSRAISAPSWGRAGVPLPQAYASGGWAFHRVFRSPTGPQCGRGPRGLTPGNGGLSAVVHLGGHRVGPAVALAHWTVTRLPRSPGCAPVRVHAGPLGGRG